MALPYTLVRDAVAVAPDEFRDNFNRLVGSALTEFIERRKEQAFAASMRDMANDAQIQGECAGIAQEFRPAEMDGLRRDPAR